MLKSFFKLNNIRIFTKKTNQLKQNIMKTPEQITFYNRVFTEQLQSLSQRVSEGELSPNTTAKEIARIAKALTKLNDL
mgnify:CR=1 FL=1